MGRSPCCDELGLKKGPWTPEEDEKLREYVQKNGHGSWRRLPKLAGLNRCGKSCRLRWTNYLRPDIKRGKFTEEEERLITQLHSHHGNKWSTIATSLPGRTDNEIKNYWNTHLRKKLLQMGIDPVTHQPRADLNLLSSLPKLLAAANLASLTSRLDNSLQLQADAAHLIRLHLVQNLVQALTRSPTPNLNLMSLFGSPVLGNHQLNDILPLSRQLDISLVNGSPILQNLSNQGLQNLASSLLPSPESSRSADAGDLMAAPADDLSSESMMMTTVCGANSCAFSTSGSAPSLVSASPEYMNKTETMSAISFDGSIDTPISATLEAWDSLDLDDLDKDLGYWKEILGQLSS